MLSFGTVKTKLALLAFLAALPMAAHHSFAAEYDSTKPVTIKGVFTKIDWINPHSWIHLDVKGPDGKVASWMCEALPPNGLYRLGWRKTSIKEGEEIVVEGFLAKDGSNLMWSRTITLANGKKIFAAPPEGTGTPADPGK